MAALYAKVNMAGWDEREHRRGGGKLSVFTIDGVLCTLVICRDGRHSDPVKYLYRFFGLDTARVLGGLGFEQYDVRFLLGNRFVLHASGHDEELTCF